MEKQDFITNMNISFIGAGNMGFGIVKNLCEKLKFSQLKILKHEKNIDLKLLKSFKREVELVSSISDTVRNADIVFVCLPNSLVSREILFDNEFIENIKSGTAIIDLTTQSSEFVNEALKLFEDLFVDYYDCPLIRSPKDAFDGKLVTLAGGITEKDYLWPLLETFSETIFSIPLGQAVQYKLLNNYICMSFNVIVQTGLFYTEILKLDRHLLETIMKSGTNYILGLSLVNQYLDSMDLNILNFKLKDAQKDLVYFYEMIINESKEVNLTLTELIIDIFSKANLTGNETLPMLYESLRNKNE